MAQLEVTELDFSGIRANLKTFLESQDEFSDYAFEGSALAVLIDLLAYNTHYNAMMAHLVANESFLDTAIKRASVLSIAKTLGYVPRSYSGSRVTATITVLANDSAPFLTLSETEVFMGTVDNVTYTFSPVQPYVASLSNGKYIFEDVELIEGKRLTNTFGVTTDVLSGPFLLPVESIDLNTLLVYVKQSESSLNYEVFKRVDTISGVDDTSAVFWIEERSDGRYELLFGDGVFGKKLSAGNVVVATYRAASGSVANNITSLMGSAVDGRTMQSIILGGPSSGGGEKESIDSIRKTAPLYNAAKNRAVNAQDYRALILKNFDQAKGVTVWGGEDNDPPIYGKVFITVDTKDDYVFTESDKDFIIEKILRPAGVISIQPEFVDPSYLYITLSINTTYNPLLTNYGASQIASAVRASVEEYFTDELSSLEKPFFPSKLNDVIEGSNPAIIANLVKMGIQLRFSPDVGLSFSDTFNFLASLEPETIKSTIFNANVNGLNQLCYIQDFSDSDARKRSTTGKMKLVNSTTNQPVLTVGTVDYTKGQVIIQNLMVSSFLTNSGEISLTAEPTDLSKNISSTIIRTTEISSHAVVPLPSKNVIIKLDDSQSNSVTQLSPGLVVSAVPFIDV